MQNDILATTGSELLTLNVRNTFIPPDGVPFWKTVSEAAIEAGVSRAYLRIMLKSLGIQKPGLKLIRGMVEVIGKQTNTRGYLGYADQIEF